jgi:hypothetical protein
MPLKHPTPISSVPAGVEVYPGDILMGSGLREARRGDPIVLLLLEPLTTTLTSPGAARGANL